MPRWSRFVHARPICPDSLSGNPLISGPSHNGNPSFADRGEACGARSHYPQGTTALHENDLVAQKRTDRSMPAKSLFASPRSYPPERGQPVLLRKRHKLSSEVSICTKEKPRRSGLKVGFVPDSACERIREYSIQIMQIRNAPRIQKQVPITTPWITWRACAPTRRTDTIQQGRRHPACRGDETRRGRHQTV